MKISDLQFGVAYVFTAPPQVLTGKFTAQVISHSTNDVVLDNGITIKTTNGEIDAAVAPIVAADSIQLKGGSMLDYLKKVFASNKAKTALVDAVASTAILVAVRVLSPADSDFALKLVAIYQPLFLALFAQSAQIDALKSEVNGLVAFFSVK